MSFITRVQDAVSACGHAIVEMTGFPVRDQAPAQLCEETVGDADVYIGVLGLRYGTLVRDGPDRSYTELEFDCATERGLPRLMFLLDSSSVDLGIPPHTLVDDLAARQRTFCERVRNAGVSVVFFRNADDLKGSVERALQDLHQRFAQIEGTPVTVFGGAGPVPVPRQLPRDVPAFTGREAEVGRLVGLLDPSGPGAGDVAICAVAGKPGVGKSALAVHVAHKLADRFPDGQLYVNLRGQEPERLEPAEVLGGFVRALGAPANAISIPQPEREGLYRSLLADRQVLVLLDNAADEAQVRPLLPPAPSVVVVTSRTRLTALGASLLDLEVMDDREATELLAWAAGDARVAAESPEATQIVALCGRLPLAVRIAGALLASKRHWSASYLGHHLAEERSRLGTLRVGGLDVHASFSLTYRQLPARDARAFSLLGIIPGPDFSASSVAGLLELEVPEAQACLERLVDAQLVEAVIEGRFRFHDLLRIFAAGCLDGEPPGARRAALERLLESYKGLAGDAAELLTSSDDRREIRRAGRARGRTGQLGGGGDAGPPSLPVGGHAEPGWRAREAVFRHRQLERLGHRPGARPRRCTSERGSAGRKHRPQRPGPRYEREARWGEAIVCYEQRLAIFRDLGDRHGEGRTLCEMAIACERLGSSEKAVACCEQSLAIFRELDDRGGESWALNNLGIVYESQAHEVSILGRNGERVEGYVEGSPYDPDIANERRAKAEEAIAFYEQSLAIARELGDRHREVRTLNNLGLAHRNQARWEEAIGAYELGLAIAHELGDRHGEAQTLSNLGVAYRNQARWVKAIACHEQSLATFRDLGDRHGEAHALENLGVIHQGEARWEAAIACYERSRDIYRKVGDLVADFRILCLLGEAEMRRPLPTQARGAGPF